MRHALARAAVVLLPLAWATLGAAGSAAADTPWGDTGAAYSGGIVCHLPGGETVPMTAWSVNGAPAFATADVVAHGTTFGAAPTVGPSGTMTAGQAGLGTSDIAAVAYLIAHDGSGSAAEVAETSADIAAATGGGSQQARCLGQHGTSRHDAAALWTAARRYAGPYRIAVSTPPAGAPGTTVTATARVTSAAGHVTPGIPVTFATGTGTTTVTTDASGQARARLIVPTTGRAPITVTTAQPTGLTYIDSSPPALATGTPSVFSGTGTFGASQPPRPTVTVTADHHLVLSSGTLTPAARVDGTLGYTGTGQLTVSGPVGAGGDKACSALTAHDFAAAPAVWTGSFAFTGDGTYRGGSVTDLAAGCYAVTATVTTTNSSPPVTAKSAGPTTVTATDIAITATNGSGVAGRGPLTANVTATSAGRARVTASLTAYGPLTPHDGQCGSGLDWTQAPLVGTSAGVSLTPAAAPATRTPTTLAASVPGPPVSRLGCYALEAHAVVTLDGASTSVDTQRAAPHTTVAVVQPSLALVDASYDGQLGRPMSGHVQIAGTWAFPGVVSVGLVSAPVPAAGCHAASFTHATAVGAATTLHTTGDGTYPFVSPVAPRNRCYAVTATLRLNANRHVGARSPAPGAATMFLAGVVLNSRAGADVPDAVSSGLVHSVIACAVAYGLVMAVAVGVFLVAAASRRSARLAAGTLLAD